MGEGNSFSLLVGPHPGGGGTYPGQVQMGGGGVTYPSWARSRWRVPTLARGVLTLARSRWGVPTMVGGYLLW